MITRLNTEMIIACCVEQDLHNASVFLSVEKVVLKS